MTVHDRTRLIGQLHLFRETAARLPFFHALDGMINPDNSLEKLRHTGEGRYPDD